MQSSRVITALLFMWKLHKHCYLIYDSLPCLSFFAPKFSIFNYARSIVSTFLVVLVNHWRSAFWLSHESEYFSQRFKFGSQKASSKCKQQYVMSTGIPGKNDMCEEAFLHVNFPLFRLLGMMILWCYWRVWFWTTWVGH